MISSIAKREKQNSKGSMRQHAIIRITMMTFCSFIFQYKKWLDEECPNKTPSQVNVWRACKQKKNTIKLAIGKALQCFNLNICAGTLHAAGFDCNLAFFFLLCNMFSELVLVNVQYGPLLKGTLE